MLIKNINITDGSWLSFPFAPHAPLSDPPTPDMDAFYVAEKNSGSECARVQTVRPHGRLKRSPYKDISFEQTWLSFQFTRQQSNFGTCDLSQKNQNVQSCQRLVPLQL